MIPAFAVVGHPNKGKSSIVATLAEDDSIAVSPTPGTTRSAHRHTFSIDGVPQYVLIDTPGFQRASGVLDWLESHASGTHQRSMTVEQFLRTHEDDERFHDECELLLPVMAGAGILYVVDGAKPYGAEYEIEMQVLRWTGRPRMALINVIGPGNYVEEWRQALDQYFSVVRVFDAVHADFGKRVALLRTFAELEESWRAPLERAANALEAEREHRREQCAAEVAQCLIDAMTMTERSSCSEDDDRRALQDRLTRRIPDRIQTRERAAREVVQSIYLHAGLRREETSASELLGTEIFAGEGWELFGLSHNQLLVSGMISGAVAGGSIDVMLGGATLLLGAGIGTVVGGLGAWFGGNELAKVKILNQRLGGPVLQVGPVKAPNFPWVLLGRAWVHQRVVAERNHARREAMSLALSDEQSLMDAIPDELRRRLAASFKQITAGADVQDLRHALAGYVEELFAMELPSRLS